ncbi:MAG TPA: GAF domain-containing protein [Solirubrobacterales bacterium]|nr:GAF domain-containing protein [Solirubrobacterales bacterium]
MSERDAAALDAVVTVTRALSGEVDLTAALDLIAKRSRSLVSARAVVVETQQEGRTTAAGVAGDLPEGLAGARESAETAVLAVPLTLRGRTYGALVAVDRQGSGPRFTVEDEELLEALAGLAAGAVAAQEFSREQRPVVLDHVGLAGSIELLADLAESPKQEIRTRLDLSFEEGRAGDRLDDEVEAAVYRIVQTALAKIVKCPDASQILVEVIEDDEREEVRIEVRAFGEEGARVAATLPTARRWRSMLNSD